MAAPQYRIGDATGNATRVAQAEHLDEIKSAGRRMSTINDAPDFDEQDNQVYDLDGNPTGVMAEIEDIIGEPLSGVVDLQAASAAAERPVDPVLAKAVAAAKPAKRVARAGGAPTPLEGALTGHVPAEARQPEPLPDLQAQIDAAAGTVIEPVDFQSLVELGLLTQAQADQQKAAADAFANGPAAAVPQTQVVYAQPQASSQSIREIIEAEVARRLNKMSGVDTDESGDVVHARVEDQKTVTARCVETVEEMTWGDKTYTFAKGQVYAPPYEMLTHLRERGYFQ